MSTNKRRPASKRVSRKRVAAKVERIGIFGTGANPWTYSHLALAEQGLVQGELDFVYLMPSGQPVDKEVEDPEIRWDLTQCVAAGNPGFVPSREEIDRNGPSYMIDTLRALRRKHPKAKLFLIVGEDRAPGIAKWRAPKLIARMCTIMCGPRYGCKSKVTDKWLKKVLPANAKYQAIEIDYSATWIRKRLAMGKSVRYMLPDAELERIKEHGVFGTGQPPVGTP